MDEQTDGDSLPLARPSSIQFYKIHTQLLCGNIEVNAKRSKSSSRCAWGRARRRDTSRWCRIKEKDFRTRDNAFPRDLLATCVFFFSSSVCIRFRSLCIVMKVARTYAAAVAAATAIAPNERGDVYFCYSNLSCLSLFPLFFLDLTISSQQFRIWALALAISALADVWQRAYTDFCPGSMRHGPWQTCVVRSLAPISSAHPNCDCNR